MEDEGTAVGDVAADLDGVAGAHGLAEAGFLDATVEGSAALGEFVAHQDAHRLSHDFAEDDTRYDGVAGEVALQEEFVAAHMVVGDGFVAFHGDVVDEQHGLAVRQEGLDFVSVKNIHDINIYYCLNYYLFDYLIARKATVAF